MIDPKVLKSVQEAGWMIESADEDSCVVRCPEGGCSMRARIKYATQDKPRREEVGSTLDKVVRCYDDVRTTLRDRRHELTLAISELEHSSGLATDHVAKLERDTWRDFNRLPNVETMLAWAAGLGIQVILRPGPLPDQTLSIIADTRGRVDSRRRRQAVQASRPRLLSQG